VRFLKLFSPIQLGHLEVRNRIVMAPMDTELAAVDGSVTERLVDYYEERAKGGVGLIITEFTTVEPRYRMTSPGIYSERMLSGWNNLAETVQAYGTKIFLQLAHHGGRALRRFTGEQPIAPSAIKSPLYPEVPRELTKEEIQKLLEQFIQAARRAKLAGFDGVEVHGGHTYLIGQFLSPHTNRRTDEYGGDFAGRMRFVTELVQGIKEVCGEDFPIGFKFSAFEALEDGINLPLAREIAQYIEELGVVYLHVASTTYGLDGQELPDVSPIYSEHGVLIGLGAKIKEVVNIPVLAGGGINDPQLADAVLRQGKVDMVVIGRALIADPHWAIKAKKGLPIRPCIRCNICHTRIMNQREIRCTVNPKVTKERKYAPRKTTTPKRVLVVGAGPAGMEAALVASQRGHHVLLWEQAKEVGGTLRVAAKPSFKQDLRLLLDYYRAKLEASKVELRLGQEVSARAIVDADPDVVILATGAQHSIPNIPGLSNANAITAVDLLLQADHDQVSGQRFIVLGAGLVGCEVGWHLALLGKEVKLIDILPFDRLMADEHLTNRNALLSNLRKYGVQLLDSRTVEAVDQSIIRVRNADGAEETHEMDTLVIATGFEPRQQLKEELDKLSIRFDVHMVGDCVRPRRLFNAINEGHHAGLMV